MAKKARSGDIHMQDRLRQWLSMAPAQFYDESSVAIVPMGFCYPDRGKSGDLPPSIDCAPLWLLRNPWFEQDVLPALRERLALLSL